MDILKKHGWVRSILMSQGTMLWVASMTAPKIYLLISNLEMQV